MDGEPLVMTIADHPANSPEGFVLNVNLEYHEELHEAHEHLPVSSRAHGIPERVDVGVSARPPPRRCSSANRGREAGPQPHRQRTLRAPLPQSAAEPLPRHASEEDSPGPSLRPEAMDGTLH